MNPFQPPQALTELQSNSTRKVLVVEDDAAIRRGLVDALRMDGYSVSQAARGDEGRKLALELDFDLLLLDLVLPGCTGLEILAEVRKAKPTVPVIILTAMGSEHDRVQGLKGGADDYVVKPFSVVELLARVQAVLRRSPERPSDVTIVEISTGQVNLARREFITTSGERIELSDRESSLVRYLFQNAGRAISREELLYRVWSLEPQGIATRTIDMHVARLREKLKDDPNEPRIILTVRGKGYMFAQTEGAK